MDQNLSRQIDWYSEYIFKLLTYDLLLIFSNIFSIPTNALHIFLLSFISLVLLLFCSVKLLTVLFSCI